MGYDGIESSSLFHIRPPWAHGPRFVSMPWNMSSPMLKQSWGRIVPNSIHVHQILVQDLSRLTSSHVAERSHVTQIDTPQRVFNALQ